MPDITRTMFVLAVPTVTETARYFHERLGFELQPTVGEGWRFLNRGVCRLMTGECPDALHPSQLGAHNYFGYLVVDDIAALVADFRARAVTLRSAVADKPWGMREFAIEFPDGHRIMFGQEIA